MCYSTTANFQAKVKQHNGKLVRSTASTSKACTCTKFECPLGGGCGVSNAIYQASIFPGVQEKLTTQQYDELKLRNHGNLWVPRPVEKYIGKSSTTFKLRWNFTNSQCRLRHLPSTALSTYVWKLKDNFYLNYKIKWKILARANPYSTATKI